MVKNQSLYKRHKTVLKGFFSIFVMLVSIAFLMDWIVMPIYTQRGKEVELPDISEMLFEEAEMILKERGLRIVKDREKNDSNYPSGTVIFQNPSPYSMVKKGRRIYVIISTGERKILVPRVVGSSERNAQFILKKSGLTLGEIFYEYSNYFPKGVVCDQSIAENDTVIENTAIAITISNGGLLPSEFVVPDIIGISLDNAKKIIRKAGLEVGEISYEVKREFVPATVISQSINPGEVVTHKQTIDLIVSRLEDEV
jgi:serine/threonine-protein kinase